MTGRHFIDSNVWIYLMTDDDPAKKKQAGTFVRDLINTGAAIVSWQVINEVCRTLVCKKNKDESFVRLTIELICGSCEIIDFSEHMLEIASDLRAQHSVSFWDSLVIAAALESDCDTLISEDMQDGRKFGRMAVRNIFASK